MKKEYALQIRVGIFVTLGLVLVLTTIFFLSDTRDWFEKDYELHASFKDISGMRVGATVFLAGVHIGKVDKIKFPENMEEKKVTLTFKILKRFQDRIRQDSKASIVTQGLLGDKVVLISVGSPDHPILQKGAELQTRRGFSVDDLAKKGGQILDDVSELSENINDLVSDAKKKGSLIYSMLYDPKSKEIFTDMSQVLKSAQRFVNRLQHGDRLGRTLDNFAGMSSNFKKVSDKIEQGEGSIGGLINDPTVYYNLMTLLGNANRSKLLRSVIRATLTKNERDLTGAK